MAKIKICGLKRKIDMDYANEIRPDYIGFVFVPESRRHVLAEEAKQLRSMLDSAIIPVGVFADEPVENVVRLLSEGIIGAAQLHGHEDDFYISRLRQMTDRPIIQAFSIASGDDVIKAAYSTADYVLLDNHSGGSGNTFDWSLLRDIKRPCFLAGGLSEANVRTAVDLLRPFAVDVSSGVETNNLKDADKMRSFVRAVREI
jgi:phosphoribosylanthranilate isomerase